MADDVSRIEVVARRTIRTGKETAKQIAAWRKVLGDEVVDKLLKEQES